MIFESLPVEKQNLIMQHLELVIEANKSINLTRIDTKEDAMILHIEDSLEGIDEINASPDGLYGDLGSGAGYPGIPLAVATGRKTVLIDSRQKKMKTVESIISKMGLNNQISTYAGRAELLARTHPNEYAVLTARALSKLVVLMELASPLLFEGGKLICYKADIDEEELKIAIKNQKVLGMRFIGKKEFTLNEQFKRSLVVFEKSNCPTIKLPRLEGEAQKHPLS